MLTSSMEIRWRWVILAVVVVGVTGGGLLLLHKYQVERLGSHLLVEARSFAEAGDVARAKIRYSDHLALTGGGPEAFEEYAELVKNTEKGIQADSNVLNLLDMAITEGSANAETKIKYVTTAMKLERFNEARQVLRKMIDDQPSSKTLSMLGRCEFESGELDKARSAFLSALESDPKNVEAWHGLIQYEESENGDEAAMKLADQMGDTLPAGSLTAKAWLRVNKGEVDEASQYFFEAAKLSPNDPEAIINVAEYLHRVNPPMTKRTRPMAQLCFDRLGVIELPNAYQQARIRGDVAQRLRDFPSAVTEYQKCLVIRPEDSFAIGRLAEVFAETGQTDKAMEMVNQLPKNNATQLLRTTLKAQVLAGAGQEEEAIRLLDRAREFVGSPFIQQVCRVKLIELLLKTKDYSSAEVVADDLVNLTRGMDEARDYLVQVYAAQQRYGDVMKQLVQLQRPEKVLPSTIPKLVKAAEENGSTRKLQKSVAETKQLYANSPVVALFEATWMLKDGRTRAAEVTLSRAIVLHPSHPVPRICINEWRKDGLLPTPQTPQTPIDNRQISTTAELTKALSEADQLWADGQRSPGQTQHLLTLVSWNNALRTNLVAPATKLVTAAPRNPDAYHLLAVALRVAGRHNDSLKYSAAAFSMNQHPVYLLHAAATWLKDDQLDNAQAMLETAESLGLNRTQLSAMNQQLYDSLKKSIQPRGTDDEDTDVEVVGG